MCLKSCGRENIDVPRPRGLDRKRFDVPEAYIKRLFTFSTATQMCPFLYTTTTAHRRQRNYTMLPAVMRVCQDRIHPL
jgi:hypothetical protein